MKYNVTARSFTRATGSPTAPERTEVIDTRTNQLFGRCRTILDVKRAYEAFWNDLNPRSTDVVFVSEVTRA